MKIELNEGTAARRRVPMRLFTSDGTSPDTSASSDSVELGINSLGTIVPDSTVSEANAANGMYFVELSASDVSVLGVHPLYHTQGSFSQHVANIEVVNDNPYSTQSNTDSNMTLRDGDYSAVTVRPKSMDYSGVTVRIKPLDYSALTVRVKPMEYSGMTVGAGDIAPATYSGVTVGIDDIKAGTYSGVTIQDVVNTDASAVAGQVWAEARSSHITSGTMGQVMQVSSDSLLQGGTTSAVSLGSGETSVNDVHNGAFLLLTYPDGTLVGAQISDYTGATQSAQLLNPLAVTPTSSVTYVVYGSTEGESLSAVTLGSVLTVHGHSSTASVVLQPGTHSGVTIQGLSNRTDYTVSVNQDKDNYGLSSVGQQSMVSSLLSTDMGSGRYIQDAFARMRNRVDATGGSVMTVYQPDDATSAWTASISTGAFPLAEINP